MQRSVKELVTSLPITVLFAGFKSNTLSLANAGWDLSVREGHHYATAAYEVQLAMRHDGARLYAITHPMIVEHMDLYRFMSEPHHMAEYLAKREFEVQCVAPGIQIQRIAMTGSASFRQQFNPMDALPQMDEIEDMKDFRFFKTANPSVKDLIVLPEMVPELLSKVLEAQAPMMDEIRKRERSRENLSRYREAVSLEGVSLKPPHRVELQLVTLAS